MSTSTVSFSDISGTILPNQIPDPLPIADLSASGDVQASTLETGTLTVSGVATANTINATANIQLNGQSLASTNLSDTGEIAYLNQALSFTADQSFPTVNAQRVNANTVNASTVNASGQINAGSFGTNGTIYAGSNVTIEANTQTETLTGSGSPSATFGDATVIGLGASGAVYGSSLSGEIDLTTGSGITKTGTVVTITFPKAFPYPPKALVVQNGYNGAWSWSVTESQLVISAPGYLAAKTFYKLNYMIMG